MLASMTMRQFRELEMFFEIEENERKEKERDSGTDIDEERTVYGDAMLEAAFRRRIKEQQAKKGGG